MFLAVSMSFYGSDGAQTAKLYEKGHFLQLFTSYKSDVVSSPCINLQNMCNKIIKAPWQRGQNSLQNFRLQNSKISIQRCACVGFGFCVIANVEKGMRKCFSAGVLLFSNDSLVHVDAMSPVPTSTLMLDWSHDAYMSSDPDLATEQWSLKGIVLSFLSAYLSLYGPI